MVVGLKELPGEYMKVLSDTNCIISLSPVTMKVSNPANSAFFTKVPIISSASNPGFFKVGILVCDINS